MLKKVLFFFGLLFILSSGDVYATHYMGGEITWECTSNGNFKFTLKAYRECYTSSGGSAANYGANLPMYTTAPGFSNITMHRLTGWPKDISPVCNNNPSFPHIYCNNSSPMPGASHNLGAIQEHIYTSDNSYPNGVPLTGVPPASGWNFYWRSCCRNASANMAGMPTWRLRAYMFPYNNQNVSTCFDNSPTFAEIPRTVICSGYPFTYNHLAWDIELDSLKYEWGQPLLSTGAPIVAYYAGYSYNNPLPGPAFNANNVAATMNQFTGEISFTSYTTGAYVTSTKVTAYKCGIKVAEIWRDMQVTLLTCGTNTPPSVTPPFKNSVGQYTLFTDTVFAGDFVTFSISGTDFEFLTNGSPQTIELQATGGQFGSVVAGVPPASPTMSTTTGCLNSPCAILTPAPNPPNQSLSGQFGLQTTFSWQTDCSHLSTNIGCGTTSNVYNFLFKVFDDYCPAPAINMATITIVVLTQPTLPAPTVHCVKVHGNGDVTLTWVAPLDTMNTFNSYHIYTSTNPAGPFTILDSIFTYSQTTYTHVGAGAQAQKIYYYLKTRSGCFGDSYSPAGDTYSTMLMNVVNPGAALGIAELDWNSIIYPNLPSASGMYKIYREYPVGNWDFIGTTADTSYVDTVTLCYQILNYRAEMEDTLGIDSLGLPYFCTSVSSLDGDTFEDKTAPAIPQIDTVTVDPIINKSFIAWNVNPSPDAQGYIIYRFILGAWTPIDTVWGSTNTTYIDNNSDPCSDYQTYNIAAFDSCGNLSPMGIKHNTIKVDGLPDNCKDKINLNWNHYLNMSPGLGGYSISYSENNGPITLLTTVSAANNSYEHTGLNNGSEYCYYMQAFDNNSIKTSTSCVKCIMANKPRQPQFVYLRVATVKDNNINSRIDVHVDTSGFVSEYRIFRSKDKAGPYNLIASLPPTLNPLLSYTDLNAAVKDISYYYYVVVVDSCYSEVLTSDTARTIHLSVVAKDNLTNVLTWNYYEGWNPGISGLPINYDIYRRIDGVLSPTLPLTILGSSINYYEDDVSDDVLIQSAGRFDYVVQAIESTTNFYQFTDTSQSNMVQALQKPKLFVPNAFTPGDNNNSIFMPMGVYVDGEGYLFQIYNRWGKMIFETMDIHEGWNGNLKGGIEAPQGVYVYYVKFKDSSGNFFEKRGTVTLLR